MALASRGVHRDKNCMHCPKLDSQSPSTASSSWVQPKSEDLENVEKDKGKGKAGSMDMDIGSSSGAMGIGVGMVMGISMLLCCGGPKLCGGGECSARVLPLPVTLPRAPQQPILQSLGSSELFIDAWSSIDGWDRDSVPLPLFSSRDGISMVLEEDKELEEEGGKRDKNKDKEIPTNDVWARLKAHLNIVFVDLALLVDVIAH